MDPTALADVATRSNLGQAWRQLHHVLDDYIHAGLAVA